ncbi:myosin-11-like isoform X1 [Atheta coriaria]|uniref:myosin-11-like isoform X1 n=1 Tax=Dalotia coriaria TaxID=877792 RepID=UPI0031F3DF08
MDDKLRKHGKASELNTKNGAVNNSAASQTSITNRLERLETEINLMLQLSSKQPRKSENTKNSKLKDKQIGMVKQIAMINEGVQSSLMNKNKMSDKGTTSKHGRPSVKFYNCEAPNNVPIEDELCLPLPRIPSQQKQTTEPPKENVKKDKKALKKKGICRCKKKHSNSALNKSFLSVSSPHTKPNPKARSRSADTVATANADPKIEKELGDLSPADANASNLTKMKIISRSCPASAHDFNDLCNLVVDLKKSHNLAKGISEQWKDKFINMQNSCDTLKGLQEQTDAQKKFLSVCFQTEMQHRKMLESILYDSVKECKNCKTGKEQLSEVKESLELQKSQNEELINVCDSLRNELALSEERLKGLQKSTEDGFKANKALIEKFESNEELSKSQASQRTEEFKKQIQDHLSEIEELRITCAKNAEWACEESTLKAKLMQENKYLLRKVSCSRQKEQKQLDQINILRQALLKVGKNDPKVKKLVHALQKYDYDNQMLLENNVTAAHMQLAEISPLNNLDTVNAAEAKNLISELTSVIKIQSSRIQELIDMTSDMAVVESSADQSDQAPSQEQKNQLEMARKEIEEVKGRYAALVTSVREMRKKNKSQIAEDTQAKTALQNEIANLSKLLDESKTNIANQAETIDKLEKEMSAKTDQIFHLQKEIKVSKQEKNEINNKLMEIERENKVLRLSNNRLRMDAIRQESIVNNLEKKFELHRHEQVLKSLAIDKEKEHALRAAQFATDKLMETMEDFRLQSQSQTKVRHVLTKLLHDKDEQLRATIDKVSSMTLDPQKVVDALKKIQPTCHINLMSESSEFGCETAIDVHYTGNDEVVEALTNAKLPSERLIDLQSEFANFLENNNDKYTDDYFNGYTDKTYDRTEDESEYDTPQLYTLHEEAEEDEEDEKPPQNNDKR